MKEILKQKFLWLGIVLVVIGLILSVVNTKMNPTDKNIALMEQAIQTGNGAKLKQALAPSVRDALKKSEAANGFSINWAFALELLGYTRDMELLPGAYTYDTEGEINGIRFITVLGDGLNYSLDREHLSLMKENGKLYLDENFY